MTPNKTLIVCVLLLGVAASAEEARAQRSGLLGFRNFQQWVDLRYDFDGQRISANATSNSSNQHRFDEKYHFTADYTLYDSRILQGMFAGDLDLNQDFSSTSGSSSHGQNVAFDYSMAGEILNRSLFPIHFNRMHQRNYIQQSFVPSYTLLTDSNYLDLYLKNKILPIRVSYTMSSNETSGLTDDRTQHTNVANVEAHHVVKEWSKSDLSLSSYVDRTTLKSGKTSPDTRKYELTLRNVTRLGGKELTKTLDTTLLVSQSASLFRDKSLNFTEILNLPLGKALNAGADFSFGDRRSSLPGGGGAVTQQTKVEHGWLQHQLFESLSTRLDLNGRQDKLNTGSEGVYGLGAGLSYVKKLPWQGVLQVNLVQSYQVTDRDLGSPQVPVQEEYTVKLQGGSLTALEDIELAHTNVDEGVEITVTNNTSTTPPSPNRGKVYLKDVDYLVVKEGNRTKIRFIKFDEVAVNDKLLIAYTYLVSPQVKYSSTISRANGSASFRDGRYRLFASWNDTRQNLISGRAEAVKLSDSTTTVLGLEGNLEYSKFAATMETVDSSQDKHQSYSAAYHYRAYLGRGQASLSLTDRYTVTDSVAEVNSSGSSVNSANVSLNYSRPFFSTGTGTYTANYTKSVGSNINRDDLSLLANIRWVYGKLSLSLVLQEDWRMTSGQTIRSDQLRLLLVRYF